MTRRQRLQAIFEKHSEAVKALAEARATLYATNQTTATADRGLGDSIAGMQMALAGMQKATDAVLRIAEGNAAVLAAQGRAIDLALEANRMAVELLNDEDA